MLPVEHDTHGVNPDASHELHISELDTRRYALEMLDGIAKQQGKLRYQKLYFARIAREHGASYREIGDALGLTGPAIRSMLRRAGEQAVA